VGSDLKDIAQSEPHNIGILAHADYTYHDPDALIPQCPHMSTPRRVIDSLISDLPT
jgi:hypothetical protein